MISSQLRVSRCLRYLVALFVVLLACCSSSVNAQNATSPIQSPPPSPTSPPASPVLTTTLTTTIAITTTTTTTTSTVATTTTTTRSSAGATSTTAGPLQALSTSAFAGGVGASSAATSSSNPNFPSTTGSSSDTTTASGGLSVIAIAGIVIGGIGAIGLAAALLFVTRRINKIERKQSKSLRNKKPSSAAGGLPQNRFSNFSNQSRSTPSSTLSFSRKFPDPYGKRNSPVPTPDIMPSYVYPPAPQPQYIAQQQPYEFVSAQPAQYVVPEGAPQGYYYQQVDPADIESDGGYDNNSQAQLQPQQDSGFVRFYQDPNHPGYYYDAQTGMWYAATLRNV